ncbi:hypothetical protein [Streptomyces sp. NPDC058279]|uniref:hypothetical protein n=1 Tax=Streptomyces sp. NPDC058279 TaxID=3346418 RepID=UPI0036E602B9
MARIKRTLAIGAALIALTVGCQNESSHESPPSNEAQNTPLIKLETIHVADDPLNESRGLVKMLSEINYGQTRLIAYANGDSCGIIVTPKSDSTEQRLHLVSKWPAKSGGGNSYPAGPYNSVSGAGGEKIWASLMCSKNAMVIDYTSGQNDGPDQIRGQVDVTQVSNSPSTSRIIIGDPEVRKQIKNVAEDRESRLQSGQDIGTKVT